MEEGQNRWHCQTCRKPIHEKCVNTWFIKTILTTAKGEPACPHCKEVITAFDPSRKLHESKYDPFIKFKHCTSAI